MKTEKKIRAAKAAKHPRAIPLAIRVPKINPDFEPIMEQFVGRVTEIVAQNVALEFARVVGAFEIAMVNDAKARKEAK